jgi:hypothetical protein
VNFNAWLKRFISTRAIAWFSQYVCNALKAGNDAASVTLPTGKEALVPLFCDWIAQAVRAAKENGGDRVSSMILDAWRRPGLLAAWEPASEEYKSALKSSLEKSAAGTLWDSLNAKEVPVLPDVDGHGDRVVVPAEVQVVEADMADGDDLADIEDPDVSGAFVNVDWWLRRR